MHDLVIRNAFIVDGTGKPGFNGDVAIDGERIAAVGGKAGAARREIDANGLLLAPGWVDVHTHYDGQATWDAYLTPSCWHGGRSNLRFLSGIIATKSGEIASVLFMRGEFCAESAFVHGA